MPTRTGHANWNGTLKRGNGTMSFESGWQGDLSFDSRFENGQGANPEELLAAAFAGCFSQALSLELEESGHPSNSINTTANVKIGRSDNGFVIETVNLDTRVAVDGLDEQKFQEIAVTAKENCPVSMALQGPDKHLKATMVH